MTTSCVVWADGPDDTGDPGEFGVLDALTGLTLRRVAKPGLSGTRSTLNSRVAHLDASLSNHGWYRFLRIGSGIFVAKRVFGLSAEGAFWATFTLPWLVLGLVSALSGVAALFGVDADDQLRTKISDAASQVMTPEATKTFITPLVDQVLKGSAGISVLGFVVALWSGSRIFSTIVEGATLINSAPKRSYVGTRGLALAVYLLGLLSLALVALCVVRWPLFWSGLFGVEPEESSAVDDVAFGLASVLATTSMMYLANPCRATWRAAAPGGAFAVLVWWLGSWGLQIYLDWLFRDGSLYGAVAAPIAVMLWIFVSTLAVFLGMTLNAAFADFRKSASPGRADCPE